MYWSCVRQRHVKCDYWILSVKQEREEFIMRRLNEKANQMLIAGYVKGIHAKEKVFEILKQEQGEGFVDTARASVRA